MAVALLLFRQFLIADMDSTDDQYAYTDFELTWSSPTPGALEEILYLLTQSWYCAGL